MFYAAQDKSIAAKHCILRQFRPTHKSGLDKLRISKYTPGMAIASPAQPCPSTGLGNALDKMASAIQENFIVFAAGKMLRLLTA
ncbi:MAG: hypothetical protein V4488_03860 [Pseudomonadota bacterium]